MREDGGVAAVGAGASGQAGGVELQAGQTGGSRETTDQHLLQGSTALQAAVPRRGASGPEGLAWVTDATSSRQGPRRADTRMDGRLLKKQR